MPAKRELSEEELQKRKEWLKKLMILFEIIERWMEKDETKKKENQRGGMFGKCFLQSAVVAATGRRCSVEKIQMLLMDILDIISWEKAKSSKIYPEDILRFLQGGKKSYRSNYEKLEECFSPEKNREAARRLYLYWSKTADKAVYDKQRSGMYAEPGIFGFIKELYNELKRKDAAGTKRDEKKKEDGRNAEKEKNDVGKNKEGDQEGPLIFLGRTGGKLKLVLLDLRNFNHVWRKFHTKKKQDGIDGAADHDGEGKKQENNQEREYYFIREKIMESSSDSAGQQDPLCYYSVINEQDLELFYLREMVQDASCQKKADDRKFGMYQPIKLEYVAAKKLDYFYLLEEIRKKTREYFAEFLRKCKTAEEYERNDEEEDKERQEAYTKFLMAVTLYEIFFYEATATYAEIWEDKINSYEEWLEQRPFTETLWKDCCQKKHQYDENEKDSKARLELKNSAVNLLNAWNIEAKKKSRYQALFRVCRCYQWLLAEHQFGLYAHMTLAVCLEKRNRMVDKPNHEISNILDNLFQGKRTETFTASDKNRSQCYLKLDQMFEDCIMDFLKEADEAEKDLLKRTKKFLSPIEALDTDDPARFMLMESVDGEPLWKIILAKMFRVCNMDFLKEEDETEEAEKKLFKETVKKYLAQMEHLDEKKENDSWRFLFMESVIGGPVWKGISAQIFENSIMDFLEEADEEEENPFQEIVKEYLSRMEKLDKKKENDPGQIQFMRSVINDLVRKEIRDSYDFCAILPPR